MTTDLKALLAQVEAATGPDRELDFLIWQSVYPDWQKRADARDIKPSLTASLDAALALVEQVLPGWIIANINQDDTKRWWAELREGFQTSYSRVAISGPLPTPALALLAALLRVLLAQTEE